MIAYNPNHNQSQAAAIMHAMRTAQIEDAHPAHRQAAIRAALFSKITNWER